MEHSQLFEKCRSYIHSHAGVAVHERAVPLPSVTISREAGSGGTAVAGLLVEFLQHQSPPGTRPWALFNRDLVQKVLADHELPETLTRLLAEDARINIEATVEEILGLHPSAWTLVEFTAQTILRLANLGHVIIVGRAAHVITRRLKHVLHVRLVAPVEMRVRHAMQELDLDAHAARKWVDETDRARRRYAYRYLGEDVENPSDYHLTLNTGLLGFEATARLIAEQVLKLKRAAS